MSCTPWKNETERAEYWKSVWNTANKENERLVAEVKRLTAENASTTETLKQVAKKYVEKGKENATLKKALELAIAKIGTCVDCNQNCSFCVLKEPDYFIQQAQQTHDATEAEK